MANKFLKSVLCCSILALLFALFSPLVSAQDTFSLNTNDARCTFKQFQCNNSTCVPYTWLCDGENDCNGGEDEHSSLCSSDNICEKNEFKCGNGLCIPKEWLCDNQKDCNDGSDEREESCYKEPCAEDEFSCATKSKECIPISWKCDRHGDCSDGSDEKGCNRTCGDDEFTCDNGKCIQNHLTCNSFNDCGDQSDEKNCEEKTCSPETEFRCNNGYCITKSWRCDGEFDCPDNSDEKGCNKTYSSELNCNFKPSECSKNPACKQQPWICDGTKDCPNGIDESPVLCRNITCNPNDFQCGDKTCISQKLRCSGSIDCADGSDELGCFPMKECNPKTHFDCGNTLCIKFEEVCSHQSICPAFGDEHRKMCQNGKCNKNSKCTQKCVNTKTGHYCDCEPGYKLIDDKTCQDVNECEISGICSQTCVNTIGSYFCQCEPGYVKHPRNPSKCMALQGSASILLTTSRDIRNVSLDNEVSKIVLGKTIAVKSLDYAFDEKLLFWSDVKLKKIFKMRLGEVDTFSVVATGVYSEGIAVDWVHKNIYWTDTEKRTVEVSDFDGKARKVLIGNLDSPRALAVDPSSGWMFWTDWGNNPKIEKAGLDGSNRQAIVLTRIMWPNGITLEPQNNRLFWIDAKLHTIFSSDYDGKARRIVLSSSIHLRHPFAIATFEDSVYWTDWDKSAVYRANKFSGSGVEVVSPMELLENPTGMRIYHPYVQPKMENACEALSCSYMCLPKPKLFSENKTGTLQGGDKALSVKNMASCVCPENLAPHPDGSCVEVSSAETKKFETTTYKALTDAAVTEAEAKAKETQVEAEESRKTLSTMTILICVIAGILGVVCTTFAVIVFKRYFNKNMTMNFKSPSGRKITDSTFLKPQSTPHIKANEESEPLNNGDNFIV